MIELHTKLIYLKMTELHTNQIRQSVSIDYVLPQKPGFYTSTKISKAN